jgi:hypothetical protein
VIVAGWCNGTKIPFTVMGKVPNGVKEEVWIVRIAGSESIPSIGTGLGSIVQVEPVGKPLQFTLIGWLNPPRVVRVNVELPELLLVTVIVDGEAEMVKSGPEPAKETVCGQVGPWSVKVSVAVRRA